MSTCMKEMATFVLASAVVTVTTSALKLIDAWSGIRLFSNPVDLNSEIRQKE